VEFCRFPAFGASLLNAMESAFQARAQNRQMFVDVVGDSRDSLRVLNDRLAERTNLSCERATHGIGAQARVDFHSPGV
jgi:hypothetical protein